MPVGEAPSSRIEAFRAAAAELERADPDLVARVRVECEAGARQDLVDGIPRGRAVVLRLRGLTVERPSLGIAVARSLGLEHIVDDLLAGVSVDGVPGIGADGSILPPSRSDRRRRRGIVLLLIGGGVLLVGATAADSLSLPLVIARTATSFVLIFGGLRDVLHRG